MQSRVTVVAPLRLSEQWEIRSGLTRISFNDLSELELQSLYTGPYYRFSGTLKAGLEYRHMDKRINGQWVPENRLSSVLVYRAAPSPLSVMFRKRLEYRSRGKGYGTEWRARGFVAIALAGDGPTPFLSNELYYNASEGRIERNTFSTGIEVPVTPKIRTELYYEYETENFGRGWEKLNIVGTSLTIVL